MNAQLVESIYKMIQSLSDEERSLLEEKLFANLSYPSQEEIDRLSAATDVYDFLNMASRLDITQIFKKY
ncbi:MAG: hypothetical protein QNJ41_13660 [Xenococcaceae cyanobacterium MO_188.B32]|nr:hypothetical protein [Xenococcaceae cyanobacterium MO_188.B32]